MKRSNFTSYLLRGCVTMSLVLFMLALSTSVQAQHCTIACNDNIQVSLGNDCRAKITYDMILEDADNSSTCSPNGRQAFIIQVLDHKDKVIAETGSDKDYVTCEDVAANGSNTFRVKAKHWATGNNCWGTITVEDKIKPEIECLDVELWCNQPFTPEFIECHVGEFFGYPRVHDNCDELRNPVFCPNLNGVTCGEVILTYKDEILDIECVDYYYSGYSGVIKRSWYAVDASGNETHCTQTIKLKRARISDIDLKASLPNYTGLPGDKDAILSKKSNSCNPNTLPGLIIDGECPDGEGNDVGEYSRPGYGGMTGEPTGFPMLHGIPVTKYKADGSGLNIGYQYPWDSYGFCEINVEYKDHVIPVCVGSYKILRTWKLVDWCTNEIVEHTQIIKVLDKEATIDGPEDIALITNTNTKVCEADFRIPDGKIWEACGEVAAAYVSITGYRYVQHPYGSWAEEEYKVLHKEEGRIVGPATGDPVIVDFGYTKLAGPRCDQDYAKYVVHYEYIDHCGNTADYYYNVTVEDKTAPTPVCDEITQVTVDRECEAHIFAETFDDGSHDACSEELTFLARRMGSGDDFKPHVVFNEEDVWKSAEGTPCLVELQVTDCHGNSNICMVQVFVDDKEAPVVRVQDKTICCSLLDNNGVIPEDKIPAPVITDNCPGYTYEREVSDWRNECYIGTVTYTYVATDRHGNVSHAVEQVITVEDCTPLEVIFPEDYNAVCTATDGSGFGGDLDPSVTGKPIFIGDDCELVAVSYEDEILRISDNACFKIARYWRVIDWCAYDPNHPSEEAYFEYVQFIKVLDQVAPELTVPSDEKVCIDGTDDCKTTVNVGTPHVTDCTPDVRVRAEWSYIADDWYCGSSTSGVVGDASGGFVTPAFYPGVLTVTFIADDGCNNTTKKEVVYTIVDCKLPTPYCRDGIRIENMPSTGQVVIWASDLDLGSFDNCDGCANGGVTVSFSPDVDDVSRTFTCSTLGTQQVELWVTDHAGNQDFCRTFVMVQDNQGGCAGGGPNVGGMAAVAGKVANTNGELIENVTVSVNGSSAAMPTPEVTGAAGNYGFELSMGGDYTITPVKDMNPLNGVSTYDLVLLRKHVLGTEVLDNPYNLIAADVNKSGSITTFDMVELRKVILQVVPTFEDNESWRFVDANYQFTTANPLSENFSEVYNINNLASNMDIDFVAIKIGDLNGTATPNSLVGAESRSAGTMTINTTDRLVQAGETVTVAFAADMANTAGYQFTLDFNGLEMVELVEGVAKKENFNTNLAERGVLMTSFDGVATDGNLFEVTFKANTTAQLSELLSVNSKYTAAEAYTNTGEVLNVALNFDATTVSADFELSQNTPNPFTGETIIRFNLPEAGMATLKVMDVQGKVLISKSGDFAKGAHQFEINAKQLNTTGVLYYQLESTDNVATKKMIVLD